MKQCPIFDQAAFASNLKNARLRKNYTVSQISEYISVTNQSVYDYERGKKMPCADRLLALMVLYEIDAEYLLKAA